MAGRDLSPQTLASIAALVIAIAALLGSLGYIGSRFVIATKTITQSITTTFTKTVTAYLTETRTVTVTVTVTRTVYPTATISKRVSTTIPSHIFTKTLDLPVCSYEVFPVYLARGERLRVSWESDSKVFVGVASKDELANWEGLTFCLSAHMGFTMNIRHSRYGYNGVIEYVAPYTGTHYIIVFTGWSMNRYTAHIKLTISKS